MRSIWMELNTYVKTLESNINLQDLGEWRILINIAQRTDAIGAQSVLQDFLPTKSM